MATKNPKITKIYLEALELIEDFHLSKMAFRIDNENTKVYKHLEVWQ
jgi:hypothetical protein